MRNRFLSLSLLIASYAPTTYADDDAEEPYAGPVVTQASLTESSVTGVTSSGPGCPAGSYQTQSVTEKDGTVRYWINFHEYKVSADPTTLSVKSTTCTIEFTLEAPQPTQFALTAYSFEGGAILLPGDTAAANIAIGFGGSRPQPATAQEKTLKGPFPDPGNESERWFIQESPKSPLWSDCATSIVVKLSTSLTLKNGRNSIGFIDFTDSVTKHTPATDSNVIIGVGSRQCK